MNDPLDPCGIHGLRGHAKAKSEAVYAYIQPLAFDKEQPIGLEEPDPV